MEQQRPQSDEARDAERMFYQGTWDAQPRWVKVLTLTVAVPAWLVFALLVATGDVFRLEWLAYFCFGSGATVMALQLFFLARAFWRMDL